MKTTILIALLLLVSSPIPAMASGHTPCCCPETPDQTVCAGLKNQVKSIFPDPAMSAEAIKALSEKGYYTLIINDEVVRALNPRHESNQRNLSKKEKQIRKEEVLQQEAILEEKKAVLKEAVLKEIKLLEEKISQDKALKIKSDAELRQQEEKKRVKEKLELARQQELAHQQKDKEATKNFLELCKEESLKKENRKKETTKNKKKPQQSKMRTKQRKKTPPTTKTPAIQEQKQVPQPQITQQPQSPKNISNVASVPVEVNQQQRAIHQQEKAHQRQLLDEANAQKARQQEEEDRQQATLLAAQHNKAICQQREEAERSADSLPQQQSQPPQLKLLYKHENINCSSLKIIERKDKKIIVDFNCDLIDERKKCIVDKEGNKQTIRARAVLSEDDCDKNGNFKIQGYQVFYDIMPYDIMPIELSSTTLAFVSTLTTGEINILILEEHKRRQEQLLDEANAQKARQQEEDRQQATLLAAQHNKAIRQQQREEAERSAAANTPRPAIAYRPQSLATNGQQNNSDRPTNIDACEQKINEFFDSVKKVLNVQEQQFDKFFTVQHNRHKCNMRAINSDQRISPQDKQIILQREVHRFCTLEAYHRNNHAQRIATQEAEAIQAIRQVRQDQQGASEGDVFTFLLDTFNYIKNLRLPCQPFVPQQSKVPTFMPQLEQNYAFVMRKQAPDQAVIEAAIEEKKSSDQVLIPSQQGASLKDFVFQTQQQIIFKRSINEKLRQQDLVQSDLEALKQHTKNMLEQQLAKQAAQEKIENAAIVAEIRAENRKKREKHNAEEAIRKAKENDEEEDIKFAKHLNRLELVYGDEHGAGFDNGFRQQRWSGSSHALMPFDSRNN